MSIGSVGSAPGDPNQILNRTPSRLNGTQPANPAPAASSNSATGSAAASGTESANALTGTSQSKLSNPVMAMLIQLQNQTSPEADNPTYARTTAMPAAYSTASQNGVSNIANRAASSPNSGSQTAPRAYRSHQEEIDAATGRYDI